MAITYRVCRTCRQHVPVLSAGVLAWHRGPGAEDGVCPGSGLVPGREWKAARIVRAKGNWRKNKGVR